MSSIVVVSGASGFIAQHIIEKLLQHGYKVVGTVRSADKAEKLSSSFKNDNLSLEIVPDIAAENAFDALFKKYGEQVKYVLHTASPFTFTVEDVEKDLLIPAVNGTRSILESIKKYGSKSVERVVVTSSLTATSNPASFLNPEHVINESSWNPDTYEVAKAGNPQVGYFASKALAERAAWDFAEENKDLVKFKLTVMNPGVVFGTQVFEASAEKPMSTSVQGIHALLGSKIGEPFEIKMNAPFIDVRDVATAHVQCLEDQKFAGQRILLAERMFSFQDVVDIVNDNFPQLKGKIFEGKPGSGAEIRKGLSKLQNEKSKELLGFDFITLEKSIIDTVTQILKAQK